MHAGIAYGWSRSWNHDPFVGPQGTPIAMLAVRGVDQDGLIARAWICAVLSSRATIPIVMGPTPRRISIPFM